MMQKHWRKKPMTGHTTMSVLHLWMTCFLMAMWKFQGMAHWLSTLLSWMKRLPWKPSSSLQKHAQKVWQPPTHMEMLPCIVLFSVSSASQMRNVSAWWKPILQLMPCAVSMSPHHCIAVLTVVSAAWKLCNLHVACPETLSRENAQGVIPLDLAVKGKHGDLAMELHELDARDLAKPETKPLLWAMEPHDKKFVNSCLWLQGSGKKKKKVKKHKAKNKKVKNKKEGIVGQSMVKRAVGLFLGFLVCLDDLCSVTLVSDSLHVAVSQSHLSGDFEKELNKELPLHPMLVFEDKEQGEHFPQEFVDPHHCADCDQLSSFEKATCLAQCCSMVFHFFQAAEMDEVAETHMQDVLWGICDTAREADGHGCFDDEGFSCEEEGPQKPANVNEALTQCTLEAVKEFCVKKFVDEPFSSLKERLQARPRVHNRGSEKETTSPCCFFWMQWILDERHLWAQLGGSLQWLGRNRLWWKQQWRMDTFVPPCWWAWFGDSWLVRSAQLVVCQASRDIQWRHWWATLLQRGSTFKHVKHCIQEKWTQSNLDQNCLHGESFNGDQCLMLVMPLATACIDYLTEAAHGAESLWAAVLQPLPTLHVPCGCAPNAEIFSMGMTEWHLREKESANSKMSDLKWRHSNAHSAPAGNVGADSKAQRDVHQSKSTLKTCAMNTVQHLQHASPLARHSSKLNLCAKVPQVSSLNQIRALTDTPSQLDLSNFTTCASRHTASGLSPDEHVWKTVLQWQLHLTGLCTQSNLHTQLSSSSAGTCCWWWELVLFLQVNCRVTFLHSSAQTLLERLHVKNHGFQWVCQMRLLLACHQTAAILLKHSNFIERTVLCAGTSFPSAKNQTSVCLELLKQHSRLSRREELRTTIGSRQQQQKSFSVLCSSSPPNKHSKLLRTCKTNLTSPHEELPQFSFICWPPSMWQTFKSAENEFPESSPPHKQI